MLCFCLSSSSAFYKKGFGLSPENRVFLWSSWAGGLCNAEPRTPRGTSAEASTAEANGPVERAQPSGLRRVHDHLTPCMALLRCFPFEAQG